MNSNQSRKLCGYDWMTIVNQLFEVGYTNQKLSQLVGVEPQLFTMIRSGVRGTNPTYEVGTQLVDLWLRSYIPVIYPREESKRKKAQPNGLGAIKDGSIQPEQQRMLFAE